MNHQINIDEAIAIAKEYHLEACAISIFILFVLITFIKNVDDLAAITDMYDYIHMQNITIKMVISYLNRINNTIQI